MLQVSPNTCKSVIMRLNSFDGIFTVHLYEVSGIVSCSASISMSFNSVKTCYVSDDFGNISSNFTYQSRKLNLF